MLKAANVAVCARVSLPPRDLQVLKRQGPKGKGEICCSIRVVLEPPEVYGICSISVFKGTYKKGGEGLFTRARTGRESGNGFKLKWVIEMRCSEEILPL